MKIRDIFKIQSYIDVNNSSLSSHRLDDNYEKIKNILQLSKKYCKKLI